MTHRNAISTGLFGGFLFLGMVALTSAFAHYGPQLRAFIHWLLTPQLVIGMFVMAALLALCVAGIVRDEQCSR